MVFHLIQTIAYDTGLERFVLADKIRIERLIEQLKWNGHLIGKPLGYSYLREKRFNGNRLYFLVYMEWSAIALVGFSDKKTQQATIDAIKLNLESYKKYVYEELKRQNLIK